jgi:hypothetical protein
MTTNDPDSPLDHQSAQAPVEGTDLGEDRQVVPGLDTGDTGTPGNPDDPHAPVDPVDPGGPDTQLSADKD